MGRRLFFRAVILSLLVSSFAFLDPHDFAWTADHTGTPFERAGQSVAGRQIAAAHRAADVQAAGITGEWRLLVIAADFSDQRGRLFSAGDFRDSWVPNLANYFSDVSNGQLQIRPYVVDTLITLPGKRRQYHPGFIDDNANGVADPNEGCSSTTYPDPCRFFAPDAITAAADAGLLTRVSNGVAPPGGSDSDRFDGVLVVFGSPTTATFWGPCGASFRAWSTSTSRSVDMVDSAGVAAEDDNGNCSTTVDPADIGAASHEIGHMVARNWSHPAGYNNLFELMDSCYPCEPTIFTRGSAGVIDEGFSEWFRGWIPAERIKTFAPPTGGTEVLAPIEVAPSSTTAPQGLKIETSAAGQIYTVECRRTLPSDDIRPIPDTGVHILRAMVGSSPETEVIAPPAGAATLWKPGMEYTDTVNDLRIRIGPDVAEGCTVTVEYGSSSLFTVPDLAQVPWLTPPMNTWETVDIWVDSPCNGFEEEGGELRYGRRADGTVIGNGDDPCANRENRLYARVRNLGTAPANNVRVRFEVTQPLGVGIRDAAGWAPLGSVDSAVFSDLLSIGPGESTVVYVPWTPSVASPTVGEPFPFHSCVRVIIETIAGEVITTNQDGDREQENIGWFEAVRDRIRLDYSPIEESIFILNDTNLSSDYYLTIDSALPAGWNLNVGDGRSFYTLPAGSLVTLPVKIQAPASAPIGNSYFAEVRAYQKTPIYSGSQIVHYENRLVGGVLLAAQTVEQTDLQLTATAEACPRVITVTGQTTPAVANAPITMEYTDPSGARHTRLVRTDAAGAFTDTFRPGQAGTWGVRAVFAGDLSHASATTTTSVAVSESGVFIVNTPRDDVDANPGDGVCRAGQGDCPLRAAIQEANATLGCDTILLPPGTYTLSRGGADEDNAATGDLDIKDVLAIQGSGEAVTIVDGNKQDTVFDILADAVVTISGLTVRNGNGAGYPGGLDNDGNLTLDRISLSGNTSSSNAGGLWNSGTLTLTYSSVLSNTAGFNGGGIYNRSGMLTIDNSTIAGNQATSFSGGGLANNGGTVSLHHATVSGNTAATDGGGLWNDRTLTLENATLSGNSAANSGGGLYNSGATVSLNNVTIAGNTASGSDGGGIKAAAGSPAIRNTIIAGNTGKASTGKDCAGSLTSEGYNVIQATDGCNITGDLTGNQAGVDPRLGPLADNGGATRTHALLFGSPAIDRGNPLASGSGGPACAETDQRGIGRPQGSGCDIGAYEAPAGAHIAAGAPPGQTKVYLPAAFRASQGNGW